MQGGGFIIFAGDCGDLCFSPIKEEGQGKLLMQLTSNNLMQNII